MKLIHISIITESKVNLQYLKIKDLRVFCPLPHIFRYFFSEKNAMRYDVFFVDHFLWQKGRGLINRKINTYISTTLYCTVRKRFNRYNAALKCYYFSFTSSSCSLRACGFKSNNEKISDPSRTNFFFSAFGRLLGINFARSGQSF